jgi:hypothetical protein
MALVVKDRVQENSTTSGTGTLTLSGAVPGFQSFAVIGDGNTTFYTIYDNVAQVWEVGIGTYTSSGTTLSRDTVLSTSSGTTSPISLAGNTVSVFVTYPAEKSVNLNASGNVSPLGTISSGTWNGSTIGVAYGGTGVTSSSGANSVVLRDSNSNITVNRLSQGTQNITASGGTTNLTAASAYNQYLTGTGGQTFRLPDATTLTDTTAFVFNNNATGTLTITDYATATVGTVAAGGSAGIVLLDNSTVGGTWDVHGYIPENVTWGTNSLALGSTVITGGTWNGGTIGTAYGGTGLTSFSAANYALYSTSSSTLTAGTLPTAAGGTNLTSYTTGDIIYASATNTLSKLPIGTTGQVLSIAGGIPSWTANAGSTTLTNTTFTATAGQTSFSVTYTPALLQGVYRNGVKLDPSDYTATSGTAIVLNTGANLGDNIQVQYFSGLSTVAVVNSITFGSTGLTPSTATSGDVTVAGTLGSGYGGTGFSTYATGDLVYASATNTLSKLTAGTNGYVLTLSGGVPTWAASSGGVTSFQTSLTGLTPSTSTTGAITLAGTLGVASGGTGSTTFTAYGVLAGGTTSTGAVQSVVSVGTSGQVLVSNGAGALPTFQTVTAGATISNDTSTASTLYPLFAAATSGTPTTIYTSNANYLYQPSNGALRAKEMEASNGLIVNNATIASNYTIPTGYNASSVGPVTVSSGAAVTIPSGSRWLVL